MKIIIGSDHAGVDVKKKLINYLEKVGHAVEDAGTNSKELVDYPDIAKKVAKKIKKTNAKAILICGSGTGMAMAANRIKGIRASLGYDTYSAKMARRDNDANILTLRARKFPYDKTQAIVKTWLTTPFSKVARYKRRVLKLDAP